MDSVDSKVFWETIAVVKSSGGVTEERGTLLTITLTTRT